MIGRERFKVHKWRGRWIVAHYKNGQYIAPMTKPMVKLTGSTSIFGPLAYVAGNAYSYKRRGDALRKARELFGDICVGCGRYWMAEQTWEPWTGLCPACTAKIPRVARG